VKIYTLFIILYSNLKAHDIALVLKSFKASGLIIRPFGVEVEVDNVFVIIAIFSSSRNYRVC